MVAVLAFILLGLSTAIVRSDEMCQKSHGRRAIIILLFLEFPFRFRAVLEQMLVTIKGDERDSFFFLFINTFIIKMQWNE